ncbi:ATP-binding cassette domain-containing protein [Bifidobacterium scaligerum]|uniref:ATP-binding cassette domain-containing protein n=1 Tax=Bifidobacterium scaligerum TaxID=2052656 RepID=UPI0034E059CA
MTSEYHPVIVTVGARNAIGVTGEGLAVAGVPRRDGQGARCGDCDNRTCIPLFEFMRPPWARCPLLGPNGAGKSTTMKLLLGLTSATSGDMWMLGEKVGGRHRLQPGARGFF